MYWLVALLFIPSIAFATTVSDCGQDAKFIGNDNRGNIITGAGEPTSCTIIFEKSKTRTCQVVWQPRTMIVPPAERLRAGERPVVLVMPQGSFDVQNDKVIMTQVPRSKTRIDYTCKGEGDD